VFVAMYLWRVRSLIAIRGGDPNESPQGGVDTPQGLCVTAQLPSLQNYGLGCTNIRDHNLSKCGEINLLPKVDRVNVLEAFCWPADMFDPPLSIDRNLY